MAIWLMEKAANRNNRAVEIISKLLPGIRTLRAVKDDMILIFDRIGNLLIGVKAVKLMFWDARTYLCA